jgi:predicted nucleic acid-binding protein
LRLDSFKLWMVSALVVHEIHRINLEREGKGVAALRSMVIREDFKVVDVDYETAVRSAELRSKHRIPLADSVIAATAQIIGCPIVSDDPHFKKYRKLKQGGRLHNSISCCFIQNVFIKTDLSDL